MRLHKCRKVENYLLGKKLMDERRIWCYAQMKACVSSQNVYGLALVCVKGGELLIYNSEYNSTELELFYSCNLGDLQNFKADKKLLVVRIFFMIGEDSFRLDIDDWKRFSSVFEGEL